MYKYLIVYELCYGSGKYVRGNSVSVTNVKLNTADRIRGIEEGLLNDLLGDDKEDGSLVILNIILLGRVLRWRRR